MLIIPPVLAPNLADALLWIAALTVAFTVLLVATRARLPLGQLTRARRPGDWPAEPKTSRLGTSNHASCEPTPTRTAQL